jgi:crossover junction endodeoxyribonuclease RuvC
MRFIGIDPSTKTGFVALDESGQVVRAKELKGVGSEDPYRMATMIDEIMDHIHPDDFIVIEGFGYASMQAVQNGGIGWGIRMSLLRRGIKYYEVAPNAVKKFVNVSGWTGETGSKLRLEGKEKKKAVMVAVKEMYDFESKSDNIVDAFIMAQIAMYLFIAEETRNICLPKYQLEVLDTILNPTPKVKKPRKKKSKS